MEKGTSGGAAASQQEDDVSTILKKARAAQQSGDKDLAYELFARATELQPQAGEAWRGRAETSTLTDDALLSTAYALALQHEDTVLADRLAQAVAARAASATQAEVPTLTLLGQKLAGVGLANQARRLLLRAVELDDRQVEPLVWLAAVADDPHETQGALRQALALDPADARARAGLEAVTRELERASASAGTGVAAAPTTAASADPASDLVRQGERALSAGDKPRAYALFTEASEKSPRNEGAWLGRARTTEDVDEALTCLEQALAINPDNMQAREARTFYRVRKLRDGVGKMQEPATAPGASGLAYAGGGGFSETPTEEVHRRRIVLLVIMLVVLVLAIILMYIRLQQ